MPDRDTDSNQAPRGSNAITSYHAHVYWSAPDQRTTALCLREWIAQRFAVAIGRVHDHPVGPHTQPMYQVAFTVDVLPRFLPWLLLNRHGLSVLIHPNTGWARDDHTLHALWLGAPLPLLSDSLPNELGAESISLPLINTTPDRSSE